MARRLVVPRKFRKFKPFAEQLRDGDVCDLKTAARVVGLSQQHLRRLCSGDDPKVRHIRRNGTQLFFEPKDLEAVFERRG